MTETGDALLHSRQVAPAQAGDGTISLTYEARLLRRKRLVSDQGIAFLVDFAQVTSLSQGEAFLLDDGSRVAVKAADEDLLEITGTLSKLAWHIGNRHTPCEIGAECLRIRADHVLEAMLRQLGARIRPVRAPFQPEGGAYGHGRTMGHDHAH
ncbi:MAG: urease accessory protein UreE [Pseudomonadota bacterium]